MQAVLTAASDGTVRCWRATGSHECLREVSVGGGAPLYQLVPMGGRVLWAAAADGAIHPIDAHTLEAAGSPLRGHAGFVSGLAPLQARTTRSCWSFSTSDGRVCRWKTEDVEGQHTAEAAAALRVECDSLTAQLGEQLRTRVDEQRAHAEATATAAARLAATEAAVDEARAGQAALIAELGANMGLQDRDLLEVRQHTQNGLGLSPD